MLRLGVNGCLSYNHTERQVECKNVSGSSQGKSMVTLQNGPPRISKHQGGVTYGFNLTLDALLDARCG